MNIDIILRSVVQMIAPGQRAYLVGGSVRDRLIGRPIHDLDLTMSGNTRSAAVAIADQLHGAFYPLDEERGTYRVILKGEDGAPLVLDIASLRGQTLEEDLRGRDFTINAMAVDLSRPNEVIDLNGGKADLEERLVRACGPTNVLDDPVRALRAIRLSFSLGFAIEPDTLAQIQQSSALIARISAERVRDELFRILDGPSTSSALETLDGAGLLAVLLPELTPLKGMRQSPPHVYLGWEHTLAVVDRIEILLRSLAEGGDPPDGSPAASAVGRLRISLPELARYAAERIAPERSRKALLQFAALYHDCAKPMTRSVDPDGRIRFFNHDLEGARVAGRRGRALALSGPEVDWLEAVIAGHMRVHHLADSGQLPASRTVYRFFRDTKPAGIDMCLLSLADTWATYGETLSEEKWNAELEVCQALFQAQWERPAEVISPPRLITGGDLIQELGLKPGPLIGRILEAVREGQAAGEVLSYEDALALARQMLKEV